MFQDRRDAGKQLAVSLAKYKNMSGVILAVPRGGVPVGYEVAKELNVPLEVVLVKKIGHPLNKEFAIGAVGLNDRFIVPRDDVPDSYIERETTVVRSRLLEMKRKFMGDKEPQSLKGKTVIVIDDGIATGNTLISTIQIIKKDEPAKIVVAAPVVSDSAAKKIMAEADELIALLIPRTFHGVGVFYEDFTQVTDEEVMDLLLDIHQLKQVS